MTNVPWTDKYRPDKLTNLESQQTAVDILTKCLSTKQIPHFLFHGSPGTGKSTAVVTFLNEFYNHADRANLVLMLNASDDRGISTVRNKIKPFAHLHADETKPKFIVLDECDNMTQDAQEALKRMMEHCSKTTRFFLICNYVSKIIDPIVSRCVRVRFAALPLNSIVQRLSKICASEKFVELSRNDEVLKLVAKRTDGDMRRAITHCQGLATIYGDSVTIKEVGSVTATLDETTLYNLLLNIQNSKPNETTKIARRLHNEGYPLSSLLKQFVEVVLTMDELDEVQKCRSIVYAGKVEHQITRDTADSFLNLLSLLTFFDVVSNA